MHMINITGAPSDNPTESPTADFFATNHLLRKRGVIEQQILKSYTPTGIAYPSIRYTFDSMIQSIQIMANEGFGADFKFNLWDYGKRISLKGKKDQSYHTVMFWLLYTS